MDTSVKRLATLSLAVSAALFTIGCKEGGPRSEAREAFQKAAEARASGGEELAKVTDALQPVATQTDNPAFAAVANSVVGEADLAIGQGLYAEMIAKQTEISRTLGLIQTKASQVRELQAMASGSSAMNPKPVIDRLAAMSAAANGDGNATSWDVGVESAKLPTLGAAKQTISQLESQLAQKNDDIAQRTGQRDKLNSQADEGMLKAQDTKGRESVEVVRSAAQSRQQAAVLDAQIGRLQLEKMQLEADLAVAKGQAEQLQAAIAAYQTQSQAADKGWKDVQQQAEAQRSLASRLATADEDSIKSYANTLATQVDSLNETMGQVVSSLNASKDAFSKAAQLADTVAKEISANAPKPNSAEDVLRAVLSSPRYRLDEAVATGHLASVYAAQARTLLDQKQAADAAASAMKALNLPVPPVLDPSAIDSKLKEAVSNADENYAAANESFIGLTDGQASDQVKRSGRAARIFLLYAWSQMAELLEKDGGGVKMSRDASALISDAKGAVQDARSNGQLNFLVPAAIDAPAPAAPGETAPGEAAPGATAPGEAAPSGESPSPAE